MPSPAAVATAADPAAGYLSPGGPDGTLRAGELARLTSRARVVEIGCGLGAAAVLLASTFGGRVYATDVDPTQTAATRRRARRAGLGDRVLAVTADGGRLPFARAQFDLALAEGSPLSFIGRPRGLAEIARVLRPGGWAAVTDFVLLREPLSPAVARVFGDSQFRYESDASYRALFAAAGFGPPVIDLVPPAGWDAYYANVARQSRARRGLFADGLVRAALRAEQHCFYHEGGRDEIGYLFIAAQLVGGWSQHSGTENTEGTQSFTF